MPVDPNVMVLKSMQEIPVVHGICHGGVDGVTFYPSAQALARLLLQAQALARLARLAGLRDCL